jgi:glutamyl-tRNA synthetase
MRGRLAPSPTGELHLGNARTSLLAWLQVRAAGGTLVMRVEDIDPGRSRPELIEHQLEDLRWLGIDWDEGPDVGGPHRPYLQSRRAEHYTAALHELQRQNRLFACVCSRRDIASASSAPHPVDEEGPRYPGFCRERALPPQGDRSVALRFRVPSEPVCFQDLVHGRMTISLEQSGGDFVVRRKDGVPAYQLAVVVDDAAMGITHVLRGADLLISTARQILLYEAMGEEPPVWAHVPLLLGPDGQRLSKRHGSVSIREIRAAGMSPEQVIGWLAWTCGLADDARPIPAPELIPRFSPDRLPVEPTIASELPLH